MKTILTFIGGGERDEVILRTAFAVATPLAAHVDCLHARVPSIQSAPYARLEFARGDALKSAFDHLDANADHFAQLAEKNVHVFCESAGIRMCDGPAEGREATASFIQETSNDIARLGFHASQRDMSVMGRARQKQGLAPDTLEHLVRKSGRPVLVAATEAPQTLTGTIMVCWKDALGTTAAVKAAAPLLAKAKRVLFVSVAKSDNDLSAAMTSAARDVAGIEAEVRVIPHGGRKFSEALAMEAEDCEADLLVAGAYGRSRGRQILFGSHTDTLLTHCDRPVFLVH